MLDKNPKSALWPSFGVAGHSMSFYAVCALLVLSLVARGTLAADAIGANPRSEAVMREAAHDEAWAPEIRRRVAELESGHMQTVPWSEVRGDHEYSAGHVLTRLIEKT